MGTDTETEVFSEKEWDVLANELSLSPRQSEVIQLLFKGHGDKQIASELDIAVPTVRTHLSRLFSRFDLRDRHELVLHVICIFRKGCRANGNGDGCPRWLSNMDSLSSDK